jgi:hypothetical protein
MHHDFIDHKTGYIYDVGISLFRDEDLLRIWMGSVLSSHANPYYGAICMKWKKVSKVDIIVTELCKDWNNQEYIEILNMLILPLFSLLAKGTF